MTEPVLRLSTVDRKIVLRLPLSSIHLRSHSLQILWTSESTISYLNLAATSSRLLYGEWHGVDFSVDRGNFSRAGPAPFAWRSESASSLMELDSG